MIKIAGQMKIWLLLRSNQSLRRARPVVAMASAGAISPGLAAVWKPSLVIASVGDA
jgi:hypothetical protein